MWCNNWLLTSLLQVSSNAQARSRMGNAAIVVTLVTFLVSNINAQDNLNDTYQDDQCSIGNVQFLLTSWQFWPLDGVLIIKQKMRILHREKKNHEKIREILFTFKLCSAELLSFWWDFSHTKKIVKVCLHSSCTL